MSTMTRAITVEDLRAATTARKDSDKLYWDMVKAAKAEGWSNTKIAAVVGVSEAAIRLYIRRHETTSRY